MGIIRFSHSPFVAALLAPLHFLASGFAPAHAASKRPAVRIDTQRPQQEIVCPFPVINAADRITAALASTSAASCRISPRNAVVRRLKVVRELDSAVTSACAGRMVISGRMADVCAELDRMAQREAASL